MRIEPEDRALAVETRDGPDAREAVAGDHERKSPGLPCTSNELREFFR
jgi:hypothetical protein